MDSSTKGAQSSVECVHCQKNASYYCNTCGEAMCSKCKNRHSKRQKSHQIVLYKDKQNPKMVSEKCRIHSDMVYMMVCENCSEPVCTKCIKNDHRGHVFGDLYQDFIAKHDQCKQVVNKLKREILPQNHALLSNVKTDSSTCKNVFDDIKSNMASSAYQLKDAVDKVLEQKIAEVAKIEKNAKTTLQEQKEVIIKHIKHLEDIVSKYEQIEQLDKPSEFILFHKENNVNNIPAIPELYQINLPLFVKKEIDISTLKSHFGIIKETKLKPVLRNVEAIERKKDGQCTKSEDKDKCTLESNRPPTIQKLSEININGVNQTRHISREGSNMWISDDHGHLVLTDIKGKIMDTVNEDIYADDGLHTVTMSGDLLIVDEMKNIVCKRFTEKKMEAVINTKEWSPKSVFCSPLNGNILIGLKKDENMFRTMGQPSGASGMVAVYNRSYERLREIRFDKYGNKLFGLITYLSQNINGDIIVSDFDKKCVIVVDELGEYQFSYSGHSCDPSFCPTGICCDSNGNILALNSSCLTVHLLDKKGTFLSLLLDFSYTMQFSGFFSSGPIGICFDDKGNLWVGEYISPVIRIYKYIQNV